LKAKQDSEAKMKSMRIEWSWNLCGLVVLLCGCGGVPPDEQLAGHAAPIIDGTDDRLDIFELPSSSPITRNADGVAILSFTSSLLAHDGVVEIPTATLAVAQNVCGSERYAGQPIDTAGECTGYLVGPRLLATAGHCTGFSPSGAAVTDLSTSFGFRMIDASNARTVVPAAEVYRVVSVRGLCATADCTALELDRPVTNHTILAFRRTGAPSLTDTIYMLGHPLVLPLKFDGPGTLFRVLDDNLIMQQIDTAGGNSGSPLINTATHVVEGTLTGRSDIGLTEFDLTPAGCNVEHRAQPSDNFFATGWAASQLSPFVAERCSGDVGGWQACGASGCGICSARLDTTVFDRYLQNHPNCVVDAACVGALSACSEACPTPTAADSTAQSVGTCEAGQSFLLEDRAQLLNGAGQPGILLNAGSGVAQIGNNARAGSVLSVGPVRILARATVTGDVMSASTIFKDATATVGGAIRPLSPVTAPPLPTLPPFPPPSAGSFTVDRGSQTRPPGSYGSVVVNGGALVLMDGDYFIQRLTINANVTVRATAATRIFVRDALAFRSPIRALAGNSVQPTFVGFAGSTVALEAQLDGTLVAPTATVTFGVGSRLTFTGSFRARVLDVRPDSVLVCR
jgi:V8-like Glu-specific endopeptidase